MTVVIAVTGATVGANRGGEATVMTMTVPVGAVNRSVGGGIMTVMTVPVGAANREAGGGMTTIQVGGVNSSAVRAMAVAKVIAPGNVVGWLLPLAALGKAVELRPVLAVLGKAVERRPVLAALGNDLTRISG